MRMLKYASVSLAMVFLAAFCAAAQGTPGNVLTAEFQTPKSGMTQQYEQGRKQKADWQVREVEDAVDQIPELLRERPGALAFEPLAAFVRNEIALVAEPE